MLNGHAWARCAADHSPDWLSRHERLDEARAAMKRLYGEVDQSKLESRVSPPGAAAAPPAAHAYADVTQERGFSYGEQNGEVPTTPLKAIVASPVLRHLLMIAVMLQLAQQLSGINAVVNYSSSFFTPLFPDNLAAANFVTLGINGGMLLASTAAILVIDRGGRRILLLLGTFVMTAALTVLVATSVLDVVVAAATCTVIFVTAFGFSVGPVPWLIFAELFEPAAVGAASSVCVPANWTTNILVSVTFPALQDLLGYYVFLPFAIFNLFFFGFSWFVVPETRGRTPAEIAAMVEARRNKSK